MNKAEEEIIEQCKAGDRYALGLLYTCYAPKMRRLCTHYVQDEGLAEDIVHDGFIIIMSTIGQLNDVTKFESWMAAVIRHLALRHMRRSAKTKFVPIETVEVNGALITEATTEAASAISEYKELLQLVETLPDGYREVFKLSVFDGMTHNEIGQSLNIKSHSSSSQLARAKKLLRLLAAKYGFVPIFVMGLLHILRIDMPPDPNSKTEPTTGNAYTEADANVLPASTAIQVTVNKAVPKSSATLCEHDIKLPADTANNNRVATQPDTVGRQTAESAASTEQKKTSQPAASGITDTGSYRLHQVKGTKKQWTASVTCYGGSSAQFSAITEVSGSVASGGTVERTEHRIHHRVPFSVSISLHKHLYGRWGIGTGISYTRLKADFATITEEGTSWHRQTEEYIGIPISATCGIWNSRSLRLYTVGNIRTDIPVSGSRMWQWTLSTGVGLQYKLTPSIGFFAEPSLNWHLGGRHTTTTIWTDRPFDVTIPFGLRFSW